MIDNILIAEIKRILSFSDRKKLIIWGTANIASYVYGIISALGYNVDYFVDSIPEHQGKEYYKKPILSPDKIREEVSSEIIVFLAFTDTDSIKDSLYDYNLTLNSNCFDIKKIEQPKPCDLIDPLLGYSRMDDIEGYKIYNENAPKKIVIYGNSSTDWSVSSIHSWPYYFSELIKKNNLPFSTYNGAVIGYYSAQELFKLIRDLETLKPDIIISFSGVNDAGWIKTKPEFAYTSGYLKHIFEDILQKNVSLRSSTKAAKKAGYGFLWPEDDATLWINNIRMMNAVCREFSIPFFSFLQPTQFYPVEYILSELEQKILMEQYDVSFLDNVHKYYDSILKELPKYDYIYDFTNIFANEEGIFYDAVHTSEPGNKKIAEAVYSVVFNKSQNPV